MIQNTVNKQQAYTSLVNSYKVHKAAFDSKKTGSEISKPINDPTLVAVYEKKAKPDKPENPEKPNHGSNGIPVLIAVQEFMDWRKELREDSKDYVDSFEDSLTDQQGTITDEQKEQMRSQLNLWLTDQRDDLTERLEDLPNGIAEKIIKLADKGLEKLGDRMWGAMEEAINRHNASIPPIDPPPVNPPPVNPGVPQFPTGSVFSPGTIRIEVTAGSSKVTLTLQETNRSKNTMFYVMDALGNRKAVNVSFNDTRLQSEFERQFKQSSMYGKTVSLEKFNRFVKKVKESLLEITDTDLERLKSKLFGKEETTKLNNKIKDFISLVYEMRK